MNKRLESLQHGRNWGIEIRKLGRWLAAVALLCAVARAQDALPSWNDGPAKHSILRFVADVVNPHGSGFVPPAERVATFDNDGTLWVEQPLYTEFAFSLARVKALAPKHPEWRQKQPFQAILAGDMKTFAASGEKGFFDTLLATHAGMTPDELHSTVLGWLATARHPRFQLPYTECVYQPMLELLAYLRANNFKTYIVSGGTDEFMRPWTERVYGIPPERVVGTAIKAQFEMRAGIPALLTLPALDFLDDGAGKPVGIQRAIGRKPIAAFGNSDGDLQMLRWTASGTGNRLMLLVHHTDADREYEYDRKSSIGKLDKALDEATAEHWVVVDMKRDWKVIFPREMARGGGRPQRALFVK
jgi:phosphoglycolate phosphatase-like HAD superfamily hydrolase